MMGTKKPGRFIGPEKDRGLGAILARCFSGLSINLNF